MKQPSEKVLKMFEGNPEALKKYMAIMEQVFESEYEVLEENVAKAVLENL